jgi:hypothetical protein
VHGAALDAGLAENGLGGSGASASGSGGGSEAGSAGSGSGGGGAVAGPAAAAAASASAVPPEQQQPRQQGQVSCGAWGPGLWRPLMPHAPAAGRQRHPAPALTRRPTCPHRAPRRSSWCRFRVCSRMSTAVNAAIVPRCARLGGGRGRCALGGGRRGRWTGRARGAARAQHRARAAPLHTTAPPLRPRTRRSAAPPTCHLPPRGLDPLPPTASSAGAISLMFSSRRRSSEAAP